MQKHTYIKKIILCSLYYILPLAAVGQNNLIPNTNDCSSTRPPFDFTIQSAWTSNTSKTVDTRLTPLAGDIDGDGNVEVFVANGLPGGGGILYVLEGKTGAKIGEIACPGIGTGFSQGVVLFKRNAASKGTIFIGGRNGSIYLYEVRDATRPLQFDLVYSKPTNVGNGVPVVADLDGDGNVEIICGNFIIDANTGNTVSTLAFAGGNGEHSTLIGQSFPLVANVDNDGYPEVIVGTYIYKFSTGIVANPTPWKICPRYAASPVDGVNMVADVDQDGNVDVVFVKGTGGVCDVTVWTPATGTEVGRFSFTLYNSVSYPFVGDIDGIVINGKKYPEICVNTARDLYAYSYTGSGFAQNGICHIPILQEQQLLPCLILIMTAS